MVYQEQVMQIVRDLAGYSLGRADLVRRAMGKKKLDVMAKEREVFINGQVDENGNIIVPGCVRNGIDAESANKIFDEMSEFAKYAFNKSHAACYAVVAYRTAYLKSYYPAEFMASMLNSFLGNLDKVPEYIDECKRIGIIILKPDINSSSSKFTVEFDESQNKNNQIGQIRFGLGSIKNVGVAAVNAVVEERQKNGEYKSFTGNMSGMLIAEYLLSQRKERGLIHKNGAFVKTIVSTNMADAIAKEYNVKLIEVLTGFKFIGEQIKFFEQQHTYEYEFGFEESYGCLVGTHARDKDAVVAVMALCEAAAYYKTKGLTLWDQMINIFEKYGYYKEGQKAITMKGAEGAAHIAKMMDDLRNNPPKKFGAWDVVEFRDYKKDECTVIATGEKKPTGLPNSNVLYYELTDDAWVCVRPSGTEPKVKFYYGVKGTSLADADEKSDAMGKAVLEMVDSMK